MLGNILETVGEKVSKFSTKMWTEVHDQSANAIDRYNK